MAFVSGAVAIAGSQTASSSTEAACPANFKVFTQKSVAFREYAGFKPVTSFSRVSKFAASRSAVKFIAPVTPAVTRCAFDLPTLPFEKTALEPYYSSKTLDFHHGKHHQAYVTNLNKLIPDTEFEGKSLEEIVKLSAGKNPAVFNNAAQIYNHTFFWSSMKPNGGGQPTGALLDKIVQTFGSFENFKTEFKTAAVTQFGSGWAWLVKEKDSLKIVKTLNAETPITTAAVPLITVDVWEHAYYLDYQNRRPDYVDTFLNNLVNWDFAAANFAK
eukprot:CAMPEP_0196653458 /NCGR_PEP_ID=MMETSP1086-20130531/3083_1 /TAXON_ID=77921 /ORGANISM="Cyanoptyche  gloeocystis , Strain SAG4.97" /LENGTH=271 /DNA_ID=CAMNT_0041984669 /DNA_START=94 /DNA_END=909 /DNA_ORIENTATION=+